MIGSEHNRADRRRRGRVAKVALVGATTAALTAGLATAGLASAPSADAAIQLYVDRNYTWDPVYSSGLVAGLLDVVAKLAPGLNAQLSDTISFKSGPPPALGLNVATAVAVSGVNVNLNVNLALNLRTIAGKTSNLYNTVGGIPQPGCLASGGGLLGGAYSSNCRYSIQLATLGTEFNLLDSYRAQIASVQGDTPSGLIPFTSAPTSTAALPTQTNQALIVLQNPDRPNGGLAARFPEISRALGLDPTMPAAGKVKSPDGKIVLNTTTLDLTWAYDPIGDFPAVFSLPAIANSIAGLLPINIVTGGLAEEPLQGSSISDIGLNLAGLLQLPLDVSYTALTLKTYEMQTGTGFYSTLVPNVLPLTAAMGLPSTVANFALSKLGSKFLLGNPVGDALAPALKILVNSAYTDVLPPDQLDLCATGCGTASAQTWSQLGYKAYDRTFGAYAAAGTSRNAATPTKFNSVDILTPAEEAEKKVDVKAALAAGIKEQMAKPFFGILVPNPAKAAAAKANPVAARTAAPAAAADVTPAVSAPDSTPALTSAAPASAAKARADRARPDRASGPASRKAAKATGSSNN